MVTPGNCVWCKGQCDPESFDGDLFNADSFCSLRCASNSWMGHAGVPIGIFNTDLGRLKCQQQIARVDTWLRSWPALQTCGLLLYGKLSGVGKTRVGTNAFNRLALKTWAGPDAEARDLKTGDDDRCGLWFNVSRFSEQYRRLLREHEAKAEWQHELCSVHNLFIDDIDKLKPSEGLMELVFAVLDDRLSESKTTILTTNLTGDELVTRWGPEVGPYLVRRLRDFCLSLNFDA